MLRVGRLSSDSRGSTTQQLERGATIAVLVAFALSVAAFYPPWHAFDSTVGVPGQLRRLVSSAGTDQLAQIASLVAYCARLVLPLVLLASGVYASVYGCSCVRVLRWAMMYIVVYCILGGTSYVLRFYCLAGAAGPAATALRGLARNQCIREALAVLPVAMLLTWYWWPRLRRGDAGDSALCKSCGYNLTGNTSGRCPECGSPIIGTVRSGTPR